LTTLWEKVEESGIASHSNLRFPGITVSFFKGEYEHSIDSKGRVSLPAKLRKDVNPIADDKFTILKGLENCLYLYPEDKWLEVEERLNKIPSFNKKGSMVRRQFLRFAEDTALDNQNRIALSARLKELVGITDRVTFIGNVDHIELWAPDVLNNADSDLSDEDYQETFERIMGDLEG